MNFLEKNLEAIIFKELAFCQERGLNISPLHGTMYRQMNLAPYGVADLIQIGYDDIEERIHLRVIECKRNVIDAATYAQAARYQAAIARILVCCTSDPILEKVLIGQRIDAKADFWALVTSDPFCSAYTYEYRSDGIRFKAQHAYSHFGKADAGDIYRPTVDEIFRLVNRIQPEQLEEE